MACWEYNMKLVVVKSIFRFCYRSKGRPQINLGKFSCTIHIILRVCPCAYIHTCLLIRLEVRHEGFLSAARKSPELLCQTFYLPLSSVSGRRSFLLAICIRHGEGFFLFSHLKVPTIFLKVLRLMLHFHWAVEFEKCLPSSHGSSFLAYSLLAPTPSRAGILIHKLIRCLKMEYRTLPDWPFLLRMVVANLHKPPRKEVI